MQLTSNDYLNALDSQTACNLSGIVYSFARVMEEICNDERQNGTDAINRHPICRLYAEQIMHLTSPCSYSDAHDACEKGANQCSSI